MMGGLHSPNVVVGLINEVGKEAKSEATIVNIFVVCLGRSRRPMVQPWTIGLLGLGVAGDV